MRFVEIKEREKEKYQSLVQANGSFLQDWHWGEYQQSQGKTVLRFALEQDGEYIFVCQGYLQKALGQAYFFMPYGPVLSAVAQKEMAKYLKFFALGLQQKIPGLFFIRFEPLLQLSQDDLPGAVKTADLDPHKTLILNLQQDEQQILAAMHPKTRYNIKVAQKHNVEIKSASNLSAAQALLLLQTAKRAGIKAFDKQYYQSLLEFFGQGGKTIEVKVYSAWQEDDLLAVNIIIFYRYGLYPQLATYLFGGSADIKRNMMAPYLLHWQTIRAARAAGYKKYDFWGVEEDPKHPWHGFSKFKFGFGGTIVEHAGSYDYILNPAWYNAYRILRKLNRIIR